MKFIQNEEIIEGRIYEHSLEVKTVKNEKSENFGKPFISGEIKVAVDEAGLNVIPVHYTYVTEMTKKNTVNNTFTALKRIIDEGKTWIQDGPEAATKVKLQTSLDVNDFYTEEDQLISAKRNEGGFVSIVNALNKDTSKRNTFKADMVIVNISRVEANEEKNIPEDYLLVKGNIFNFRKELLPVEFVVKNPAGIKYFEELEVSNSDPRYCKVWGRIHCASVNVEIVEESAFGGEEAGAVTSYERKIKEWIITGTSKVPYEFGDSEVLTQEELNTAQQNREIKLAELKKRNDEYRASKKMSNTGAAGIPNIPVNPAPAGAFNF